MRSKLFLVARYFWHKSGLREIYLLRNNFRPVSLIRQIYEFYKNILFFRYFITPDKILQERADSPPAVKDLAIVMSRPPGYEAVDYDKIKPIDGISVKYYEAGAFRLRKKISRSKIGMPLNADPDRTFWIRRPMTHDDPMLDHGTHHFKHCIGVSRMVGESFALQVFHLFACFLVLRKLKQQKQEVECLILDGDRDKLSELYTACLPGCHFPEDRSGVHFFNSFIAIEYTAGGGDLQWRKMLYTCGLAGEFHRFVLSAFGVALPEPVTKVKKITLVRRKQYIGKTGKPCIDRVIKNEEEIIAALKNYYQDLEVQAVYLEDLNITDQLNQFTQSDILAGMHGAGVIVGAYFTPPNAGILELFPKYFRTPQSSLACRAVAASRKLHYQRWLNHRRANEFGTDVKANWKKRYHRNPVRYASLTRVPVPVLTRRIDRLIRQIERRH